MRALPSGLPMRLLEMAADLRGPGSLADGLAVLDGQKVEEQSHPPAVAMLGALGRKEEIPKLLMMRRLIELESAAGDV